MHGNGVHVPAYCPCADLVTVAGVDDKFEYRLGKKIHWFGLWTDPPVFGKNMCL